MTKRRGITLIALLSMLLALLFAGTLLLFSEKTEASAAVSTTVSALPTELSDLFTDYTRTELSEKYRSEDALAALENEYKEQYASLFARAEEVLRGNVRFEPARAFSTKEGAANKIDQYGNVSDYSDYTLKWMYASSDLQITGLYGKPQEQFTVYVDAEQDAYLPHLILTEHHGAYRTYRSQVYLNRGANTFTFDRAGAGGVYIVNPYDRAGQRGEVSLYIEGGDFYPVFEKDGDKTAFLGNLAAYEEKRQQDSSVPDLAELVTDYAFFTTTSSSLYETYITTKTIDPQENLELWGDFFKELYEFNGIPTSEESVCGEHYDPRVEGVRLNFRYMQAVPNSGAYAYHYHIGFYEEHYWFANFFNNKRPVGSHGTTEYSMYAMGHEIGHMLDADGRTLAETTNNMSATYAYLKVLKNTVTSKWQPYGESLSRLAADSAETYQAYSDIHILYTSGATLDCNYMVWWYLENNFPHYWAKLNDMYRHGDAHGLVGNERMVYFSSLVTGVDLGSYFDRWGMYVSGSRFVEKNASSTYHSLMQAAKEQNLIAEKFNKYYYADDAQYDFVRNNIPHTYDGETPTVGVKLSDGKRVVTISGKQDPAHLGYEVHATQDGVDKVVGFTRSVQFIDEGTYSEEPSYSVIPINRFFEIGTRSNEVAAGESLQTDGVCRVGDRRFNTLAEGIENVQSGGTVYLLADCSLSSKGCYKAFTLEVDDEAVGEIRINNGSTSFLFQISENITLRGKPNAHIVIDGGSIYRLYPPIYAGGGSFTAEYVDFRGCASGMGGGAVLGMAPLTFSNCTFSECTGKEAAFISSQKDLRLENCTFQGEGVAIALQKNACLTLAGEIPALSLTLSDGATVRAEKPLSEEELSRLTADGKEAFCDGEFVRFGQVDRTLTFEVDGETFTHIVSGTFVFGDENIPLEGRYITEYRDETGTVYHAGEKLQPKADMSFTCATEQNVTVSLLYRSGKKDYSMRADASIYLPKTDGSDKIARWTDRNGNIYPAGGSAPVTAGELLPVYEGYFRYDFMLRGNSLSGGYVAFGTSVELPACEEEEFLGWAVRGTLCEGNVVITEDSVIDAVFEGDIVEPEESEGPEEPVEPVEPEGPEEPDKPVDPQEPDNPDKPVDPEGSEEPVEPEEKEPVDPEEKEPIEPEISAPTTPEDNEPTTPESKEPQRTEGELPPSAEVEPPPAGDPEIGGNTQQPDQGGSEEKKDAETKGGCNSSMTAAPFILILLALPVILFRRKKS